MKIIILKPKNNFAKVTIMVTIGKRGGGDYQIKINPETTTIKATITRTIAGTGTFTIRRMMYKTYIFENGRVSVNVT